MARAGPTCAWHLSMLVVAEGYSGGPANILSERSLPIACWLCTNIRTMTISGGWGQAVAAAPGSVNPSRHEKCFEMPNSLLRMSMVRCVTVCQLG